MPGHSLLRLAHEARTHRNGDLRHDLAVFANLLRATGIGASPAASLQALRALTMIRLDQPRDFRSALACCLTGSIQDRARFDAVYETFWTAEVSLIPGQVGAERSPGGPDSTGTATSAAAQPSRSAGGRTPGTRSLAGQATYSREPGTGGKVAAQPRREIDELCRRLARALGTAPGRRLISDPSGETVDVRASLRHNLRFGEELVLLQRTARRRDRPRVAVLCDVSSSMMPHAALFLAFVHSLTRLVRHVESAVFNVEMAVVTEVFRGMPLSEALRWMDHQQAVLSGGTRIGHCLHRFLGHLENCSVTGSEAVVLILSDGWDVGDVDLLRSSMQRLRGQAGRVIWCDPHAAAAGYQPQVQGLRAALPYVDDYLDFSSVASVRQLVERFEAVRPSGRPHGSASIGRRLTAIQRKDS
jgi:uncharacterized protein with von Willebrand factor type A (vWA) domain